MCHCWNCNREDLRPEEALTFDQTFQSRDVCATHHYTRGHCSVGRPLLGGTHGGALCNFALFRQKPSILIKFAKPSLRRRQDHLQVKRMGRSG